MRSSLISWSRLFRLSVPSRKAGTFEFGSFAASQYFLSMKPAEFIDHLLLEMGTEQD